MTQTLLVVVLFVGAMALLPWLVRRLQQRHAATLGGAGVASRVVSAVAVGPQQRVVTVEVGPEADRVWLVLGVTTQQIHCLHVARLPADCATLRTATASPPPSFAQEVSAAAREQAPRDITPHG